MNRFICTLFLIIFTTFIPVFSLTAVVQDAAGDPIEGVVITFALDDTILVTDSTGGFSFNKGTPIFGNFTTSEQAGLTLKGNSFMLSLPKSEKVDVSLFNTRGQRVMAYNATMNRGIHSIKVPELATGLYVIHASIGSESFTKKFISQERFSWSGLKSNKTVLSRSHRSVIDTVYFNYPGFTEVVKTIEAYDADLGTIVMAEGYDGDWYGFEKFDIDTVLPNFVNILFRAYDQYGYGITSIDSSRFTVLEDGTAITSESELKIEKATTFSDTIRTVMLLDHSKSVEANLSDIKDAAKEMVRNIAPHQEIAIYAFSETTAKFSDFTSDTTALLGAINSIPIGYSSTNLYGALIEAFGLIDNYASVADKTIMFGNVVLFTDGRDTQGSKTLSEVLTAQRDKQVFSLGLGSELDIAALEQISGSFVDTTSDVSELAGIFEEIQYQISTIANSFYWAHYRSPKRGDFDHILEMKVDSNSNVDFDASINGTFNSILFQAGWAPTVDSVAIYLNSSEDSLIGYYVYDDKDGELEGASNFKWFVNGVDIEENSKSISLDLVTEGDEIMFKVQPVSLFGSPQEGDWDSSTTKICLSGGILVKEVKGGIIKTTRDSCFIIATTTNYDESGLGNGMYDAYIVKLNRNGDTLWTKTFGTSNREFVNDIILANDSGFVILGTSVATGTDNDAWIFKIQENGDLVWSQTFGNETYTDYANSVVAVNGGYNLVGESGDKGLLIAKIYENGNLGSIKKYDINSGGTERAKDIITTEDGNCIVAGYGAISNSGYGRMDALIMKTDINGNTLWLKDYGTSNSDYVTAITRSDSGYIFVGTIDTLDDIWITSISDTGLSLWTKSIGTEYFDRPVDIIAIESGYFILSTCKIPITDTTYQYDILLQKINNNGEVLSTNLYGSQNGHETAKNIVPYEDGYLISGSSDSYSDKAALWLLKVDDNGDLMWSGPDKL